MLILYFKHSGESNDCYGLPSCAAKLCRQAVPPSCAAKLCCQAVLPSCAARKLCCAVLCCAVLCCAVLCCAVLCCGQATRMAYTSDTE